MLQMWDRLLILSNRVAKQTNTATYDFAVIKLERWVPVDSFLNTHKNHKHFLMHHRNYEYNFQNELNKLN